MPEEREITIGLSGLKAYQELSDVLRAFEAVAIESLLNTREEERVEFANRITHYVHNGYELLRDLDGRLNCGPLCPGNRICTWCRKLVLAQPQA